jgi:tetratricopeptide (TPR) repeat protein
VIVPDGPAAPAVEWLFVDNTTPLAELVPWLAGALSAVAWTCHVVVAAPDPEQRLLGTVIEHLDREPLATVHLHQVVLGSDWAAANAGLMQAAERFQDEAYRERTGARLVPLPISGVPADQDLRPALDHASDLVRRLAKPSLIVAAAPDHATSAEAAELGLRIHVAASDDTTSFLQPLTTAHVLDSALDSLDSGRPIVRPCRPHLVVHRSRIHGCARQWQRQLSDTRVAPAADVDWHPDAALCAGCIADAIAASTAELDANLRRREGRELALRTSAELVDLGHSGAAAEVARTAVALSDGDGPRCEALIQAALCLLEAGRLADADRALVDAASMGAPPGPIAYHRAHVQVAWRDDIEALDHFAAALAHGTDVVTPNDLHLEMALSHIRLEEWSDAREHLELAGPTTPDIAFNMGVCELNEGRAALALEHFDRCLELGPVGGDLGRVLFFRGFSLKELARWDEAVRDLERSIGLETPELAHHNTLGFCLFKLGRHAEAIDSFEQAVEIDPTSAVDWANIAVNLERLGNTRRAAELYRKALAMDPSIGFAAEGLERLGQH